jgi:hypothetical protein
MKKIFILLEQVLKNDSRSNYLVLLFFGCCLLTKAQRNIDKFHAGTGINTYISSNGHGAYYSPFISFSKGKNLVMLGGCIQKRYTKLDGVRVSFAHLLAGHDDDVDKLSLDDQGTTPVQLRFLSYVQYLDQAALSYNRSRIETITNREMQRDWNAVKLSTIEGGLGAEIDVKFKYFTIQTFLTLSAYYHINYIEGMYHERCSPALTLGTGILIPKF